MGPLETEPLVTSHGDLSWSPDAGAVGAISETLNAVLADLFTLHLKTKNFHWHVSGSQFRDYHLMFDEQAKEIFNALEIVAGRVRKVGGSTIRSVEHVLRLARLRGNDAETVPALEMLRELRRDNRKLSEFLRDAHLICTDYVDVGSAGVLATLIDEAEKRVWHLTESLPSG
jgi:starvation-inducible DNA-binding protein